MLVQELFKLQKRLGSLPPEAVRQLAERMAVPQYRFEEVISFYPHFRKEAPPPFEVKVCVDLACRHAGGLQTCEVLKKIAEAAGSKVHVHPASCLGRCDRAPAVLVEQHGESHGAGHGEKNGEAHSEHAFNLLGRTQEELSVAVKQLCSGAASEVKRDRDIDLPSKHADWKIDIYANQESGERYRSIRQFVKAKGEVEQRKLYDPEKISELERAAKTAKDEDDEMAWAAANAEIRKLVEPVKSSTAKTQEVQRIINALHKAKLLGMGGAGGRAYKKWWDVLQAKGHEKYVVCNADESEPGTFKDRELLLHAPHVVIEGMILAGLILGAKRGYIYVRHEYGEPIARIEAALDEARKLGALGQDILKEGVGFELEVFVSPGGYICGEQTALIEAIEDKRAEPRIRPPELQTNGLWDQPTLLNNVETFAWVPGIVAEGDGDGGWYLGPHRKGYRFFSVSGDVAKPGAYEVPIGITLGELIERCGGMKEGKAFYAVALSGPSGGILPAQYPASQLSEDFRKTYKVEGAFFDLKKIELDLGVFRKWRKYLGAAIFIMGEGADVREIAHACTEFFARETCGKCVPCRLGTQQLVSLSTMYTSQKEGAASPQKIAAEVKTLAVVMQEASICGLGKVASEPLANLVKYFPNLGGNSEK